MFFINAFVWTFDPRRKGGLGIVSPMILWPVQIDALRGFDAALERGQDAVIEKSRDMGASWCLILWFLWRWIFFDDQSLLLISRKEDLVDGTRDSLFGHLKFVLQKLPPWLLPRYVATHMKLVNLDNGSVIEGESTNENVGRGGRRTALGWDEAAAFPRGGFDVAASTADTTDTRILNSTPMGTDTAFYDLLTGGAARVIRMHWSTHPRKARGLYRPNPNGPPEILDASYPFPPDYPFSSKLPRSKEGVRSPWYDQQERRRGANPQLFAREVDIDHAGAVQTFVDQQWLDEYIAEHARDPLLRGDIQPLGEDGYHLVVGSEGPLQVWCPLDGRRRPPQDRTYIIACDIGMGSGRSDSVASVADRYSGEKVAVFKSALLGVDAFARSVIGLARFFSTPQGRPKLIWEANGPGGNFRKRIIDRWKWPNFYLRTDDRKLGRKVEPLPGWFSDGEGKGRLLIDYLAALSADRPFLNPSRAGLKELGRYEMRGNDIVHPDAARRDDTSKDFGRNHGDEVIADALLVHVLGPVREFRPELRPAPPVPHSLAWRRAQRHSEES